RDQGVHLLLKDHRDQVLLKATDTLPLPPEGHNTIEATAQNLLDILCEAKNYERIDCLPDSLYGYRLVDDKGLTLANFPTTFPSPELRDEHLACTVAYFSEAFGLTVAVKRIEEGSYCFQLVGDPAGLDLLTDEVFWQSAASYETEVQASSAGRQVLNEIRSGQGSLLRSPNGVNVGYGLKLKVLLDDEVVCDHPVIYTVRDDREAVRDYFLAYHNCLLDNKVGIRLALDAEEKGYYFELLAEDETTVYLRTKDTYADELAACAAGLALITAAQSQHGYLEVQTNGKYTFHVIDADGEAIGIHPNQFDTEAARDAQLEEVKSFFALRQLDYQIVQEPNYFNWNIQAGADGPVLCTTLNFQSEAAAQQNWEYLPADLGRVDHYRVVEEDSQ
ncbi:MAG: hypothetical protein AAFU03_17575, partial [Bacteroidota bacterium]